MCLHEVVVVAAAFCPSGAGGATELTEHAAMAPDSSSATSSCNSSTPSSPAIYHLPSSSPSGLQHATRSADYTGHLQAFHFPGTIPDTAVVPVFSTMYLGQYH